jgi:hypothetical protein
MRTLLFVIINEIYQYPVVTVMRRIETGIVDSANHYYIILSLYCENI